MLSLPDPSANTPSAASDVQASLLRGAAPADAPRVLAILNLSTGWSRGVLRGFMAAAHEHRWTVLHYPPPVDLEGLVNKFAPSAILVGPDSGKVSPALAATVPIVSVALDLSSEGIPSVCPDEERIGVLALEHLLATGLRHVSTFRLDGSQFGVARERAFVARAGQANARVAIGWGSERAPASWRGENAEGLIQWLLELPKPCGLFTCADHWARIVARYVRLAGLRVPDDIALVGADNDVVECELLAPPLSSVMVPWQELGMAAARLVQRVLNRQRSDRLLWVTPPLAVAARRSSEILAIEDVLVAKAVRWIHQNAQQRLNVPMVAAAVGGGRKRLERRFRRALDRTVQEEIRRARVERAKGLLQTTRASLPDIAKQSGFSNAALLSVAFKREVGIPPGIYRRRVHEAFAGTNGC
jgi:LacI family transcriptional regulator